MKINQSFSLIIGISDQHFPYSHPDIISFMKAIIKKYKYNHLNKEHICLNVGDELDHHALNFHQIDPDLLNHGQELKQGIKQFRELFMLFNKMLVCESNHGSLGFRRGMSSGLSKTMLKSYNELYELPLASCFFAPDFVLNLSNGEKLFASHGKGKAVKLAEKYGFNVVQGHYHDELSLHIFSTPIGSRWAIQAGCLINNKSSAYNYNKTNQKQPIMGTFVVKDGNPILEPMILDRKNRWVGSLV